MVELNEIALIIDEVNGVDREKIYTESCLFKDLEIWGDDAWDLIEHVEEKYQISFEDFEFSDYFPSEGSFKMFFGLFLVHRWYKPLTIKEFIDLINKKIAG